MSNRPIIRFNGYQSEWQTKKFSSVFTPLKNNTLSRAELNDEEGNAKNVHYGDVLIKFGEYLDAEKEHIPFITSDELAEKLSSFALQNGDIIIADTAEDSTVGKCTEIGNIPEDMPVVSGLHTIPVRPNADFASGYLGYFMNSNAYHDQLIPLMQGTKVSSITKNSLSDTDINFPKEVLEQGKISMFLRHLSDLIMAQQQKQEKYLALRNACLDKMFPRSGSLCPEIRFDGFADNWKELRIEDLITDGIIDAPMDGNHGEKHPKASDYVAEGIPFLMASDIHNGQADIYGCQHITQARALALDKGFAINGDVLLTHKATIGETAILKNLECEFAMLTPQVTYYRVKDDSRLNREFLYAFFNSFDFQAELKEKAAQSTRAYIGISAQRTLKILLPQNVIEQAKIGSFFVMLDELISLHDSQLRKLNQFKESMLHNMLV